MPVTPCVLCRHFHQVDADGGECREGPPRVFLITSPRRSGETEPGQEFVTKYPDVKSDGWCGKGRSI